MKTNINAIKMKLISFALFCAPLVSLAGDYTKTEESEENACLEISGTVQGIDHKAKGTTVVCLMRDNHEIKWIEIKPGKSFCFHLNRNAVYTIKVWNPEYIDRSITINTHLPSSVKIRSLYRFEFDLVMTKKNGVTEHDSDNEFPVAIVSFQGGKGFFDYSRKYTALVKKEMFDNREVLFMSKKVYVSGN
jgi:hypothetical protein